MHRIPLLKLERNVFCAAVWLVALFAFPITSESDEIVPFRSESIRCGNTLFVSGQGSRDAVTGEHSTKIATATRQAMLNVQRVLVGQGYSLTDVVAATVWLTDMGNYSEMNRVYRTFFGDVYPTRTTLGVSGLPGDSMVQVAVVAVKGVKKPIYPAGMGKGSAPYTPGILTEETLYLSGSVGLDPATGTLVEGDITAHVTQTLQNIGQVLEAAEMKFENVVSSYFFFENVDDFGGINETWRSFTRQPRPCRLPVGVSALPLESPLEVTMVASRNDRRPFLGGTPPSDNYSRGLQSGELMYFPGVFQREGSMQEQVDAILDWNGKLLAAADLTLEDVVEVRVYMTDRGDYEAMDKAFERRFHARPPTRATVFVPRLPANSKLMMGWVAVKSDR